jgi:hypothetical protein
MSAPTVGIGPKSVQKAIFNILLNLNSLEALTNSTQASNKQNPLFGYDPTPRISTRLRKAPATKTNDFLWETKITPDK